MNSETILTKVRDDYNSISQEFSESRQADWPVFEAFLPYLNAESRILDLGCGNGRLFSFLKRHGCQHYLGIDGSEALIELARKAHPDADFEVGAMERFEPERQFDVLIAVASFHHLPPDLHAKTLQHWHSLLKPQGVLIMVNWNFYRKTFWKAWVRMFFLRRFGFKGLEIPWKNKVYRYYYAFSLPELRGLLEQSGFTLLHAQKDVNFLTIAQK